jgi:hypothetical protein
MEAHRSDTIEIGSDLPEFCRDRFRGMEEVSNGAILRRLVMVLLGSPDRRAFRGGREREMEWNQ